MKLKLVLIICSFLFFCVNIFAASPIVLDGEHLTLSEVIDIARNGKEVTIAPAAYAKAIKSYQALLAAAQNGFPIYGLNHGVGQNKDKQIFHGSIIDSESKALSEQFNKNILYAHSAGFGDEAPPDMVRGAMLIRLNTLLQGHSGISPKAVDMYLAFLNKNIIPVLPCCGSMGEADITILSHIGLAMIGEGKVYYKGKKMSARKALQEASLPMLKPFAKDALTIISSNAYSASAAILVSHDLENLLNKYDLTFALSLEALNGNVAPYLDSVQKIRPYSGQIYSAAKIRHFLQGSYLWNPSKERALQDPLSFRTVSQLDGATREIVKALQQKLLVQINSSDDNPAVFADFKNHSSFSVQKNQYYVERANINEAVIPTANFEPIGWVLDVEELGIALSHLSNSSSQRILKLGSDNFTKLSRFLSPDQTVIAYGAIQKPVMALNTENQHLSNPVSAISFPVAGDIEDISTNAPLAVFHVKRMIDNLYRILGIEVMHANQAIDLRESKTKNLILGEATKNFHSDFRKVVPFLNKDRILTDDIQKSYEFIKQYPIQKNIPS